MRKLLTHQVPKRTLLSLQNTCLITMESPLFPAESLPHAVSLTDVLLSYASECFCVLVTDCMQDLGSFLCLLESAVPSIICYSVEHLSVAVTVPIECFSQRGGCAVSASQLVEALQDKLEGQRFGSILGHWNFLLSKSFWEV
jgi:hypothetical protein